MVPGWGAYSAPCRPFNYSSVVRHLGPGATYTAPWRPLKYSRVVRPPGPRGALIVYPGGPCVVYVPVWAQGFLPAWCARLGLGGPQLAASQLQLCGAPTWAPGGAHSAPQRPLEYGSALHVVRPPGPRGARLRPRGAVSWRPITAVAWGAHLGPIGSLTAYFGDPLNTVVRRRGSCCV